MTKEPSFESGETDHSYLDAGRAGPSPWIMGIGALVVLVAVVAAFYGLYSINRGGSPTLTPDPARLTQAAAAVTEAPVPTSTGTPEPGVTPSGTATVTQAITPTVEPLTYTVQQGDTLIGIAERLNVDVDALMTLNQLGGEAIFPDQVLHLPPTATPWAEGGPFFHKVNPGETLIAIAVRYQVSVDEIMSLNSLSSDMIVAGQQLMIPDTGVFPPTPTATPEPWSPAVITGSLDAVYALTSTRGQFTLHVPPDTRAAQPGETPKVAELVQAAVNGAEGALEIPFSGRFDVFVADTLFEAPYTGWRSLSLPAQNRLFLLYDGSGTPVERSYFAGYGVAQLIAAQKLGEPASPLLREGLAAYVAAQALQSQGAGGRGYLTPAQFCTAHQRAGALPRVSRELTFGGHLGYMDQHFAAGCFVAYLVETEGIAAFKEVYLGGDYRAVYDRTLNQLEADWIASLQAGADDLPVDAEELVQAAAAVDEAYRSLWSDYQGTPSEFAGYERLDRARLSLLQGRLDTAREHLDAFRSLAGGQ